MDTKSTNRKAKWCESVMFRARQISRGDLVAEDRVRLASKAYLAVAQASTKPRKVGKVIKCDGLDFGKTGPSLAV